MPLTLPLDQRGIFSVGYGHIPILIIMDKCETKNGISIFTHHKAEMLIAAHHFATIMLADMSEHTNVHRRPCSLHLDFFENEMQT